MPIFFPINSQNTARSSGSLQQPVCRLIVHRRDADQRNPFAHGSFPQQRKRVRNGANFRGAKTYPWLFKRRHAAIATGSGSTVSRIAATTRSPFTRKVAVQVVNAGSP
jgi:hypothetical protein